MTPPESCPYSLIKIGARASLFIFLGLRSPFFGDEHQAFAEEKGVREKRRANFSVPFSLFGIFFFSKRHQSVKPDEGHVDGIEVADGLDVRVKRFFDLKSREVQLITQFGKGRETDMMKWMARGFVQRTSIAAKEATAKKSHAGPQRRDVWSCYYQGAAGFQDSMDFPQK